MAQHPTAPHPDPRRPGASDPQTPPKAPDLTVNKVIAGAGAAATSAILGSFFGVAGTVAGAAIGSVASTVAATLYQRSLDRTRDSVIARIRVPGGRSTSVAEAPGEAPGEITVPMPRLPVEGETVRLRAGQAGPTVRIGRATRPGRNEPARTATWPEPAGSPARVEPAVPSRIPRRRIAVYAGATVLVFVIGLLAVTGIEWVKGSTLTSGESGTSVGRVLGVGSGSRSDDAATPTPDPTSTPGPSADPSADPSAGPSATSDPGSTGAPQTSIPAVPGRGSDGGGTDNSGSGTGGSGGDPSSGGTSPDGGSNGGGPNGGGAGSNGGADSGGSGFGGQHDQGGAAPSGAPTPG